MHWKELQERIGKKQPGIRQLWEAAKEAHATGDFSNLLATSLNKKVVDLFQGWTPQHSDFTYYDETNKLGATVDRVILSDVKDLYKKPEGMEIRHTGISDTKFTIKTDTWATGLKLTRETIINDDTGELRNGLPERMFRAASRTLEKQVAKKLIDNGTAYDASAFFYDRSSSARAFNNLATNSLVRTLAGAGYVVSACQAMRRCKDISGKTVLGYAPRYIICPVAIDDVVIPIAESDTIANTTEASATCSLPNPAKRYGLKPISWTYLDDYDTNNWYICTDPKEVGSAQGLIVSFLNGRTTPMILGKKVLYENNGVDAYGNPACDIEFDIVYDFGVNYGDPCTFFGNVTSGGAGAEGGTS